MTATALRPGPAAPASGRSGLAGFGRLLRCEWTKIWSVRSTAWSLAILVVGGIGLAALIAGVMAARWDTLSAADRLAITVKGAFGPGLTFAQLPLCVLGVLVITSEYTTGMIRSSLLAVPRRTPLLAAKAAVFAGVAFAAGELLAFASVPIAQAMIGSRVPDSLSDPATLRAAFGAGLYLAALGLFALAVGALIRHTAAAITAVIMIFVAFGDLSQLLPGTLGRHINAYMPANAGILVTHTSQQAADLLSPWQGLGVLCLWTALLLAAAGFLLTRRDA
jgi:ABC-type transport system involved in multi-copper enzyme maturation permease subunit